MYIGRRTPGSKTVTNRVGHTTVLDTAKELHPSEPLPAIVAAATRVKPVARDLGPGATTQKFEVVTLSRPIKSDFVGPTDQLKMAPRNGAPKPAALASIKPRHRKSWR